jgi:phage terminase small subunit
VSLNARQQQFALEYLVDLNATQAAIRAGYSAKTAGSQGFDLLKNPEIEEAIRAEREARQKATGITVDRVLQEYAKVAFANMEDYVRRDENDGVFVSLGACTREQMAAVSEIHSETYIDNDDPQKRSVKKIRFKLASKQAALDSIGKHLGMFVERVAGADGGPVQVNHIVRPAKSREEWERAYVGAATGKPTCSD